MDEYSALVFQRMTEDEQHNGKYFLELRACKTGEIESSCYVDEPEELLDLLLSRQTHFGPISEVTTLPARRFRVAPRWEEIPIPDDKLAEIIREYSKQYK